MDPAFRYVDLVVNHAGCHFRAIHRIRGFERPAVGDRIVNLRGHVLGATATVTVDDIKIATAGYAGRLEDTCWHGRYGCPRVRFARRREGFIRCEDAGGVSAPQGVQDVVHHAVAQAVTRRRHGRYFCPTVRDGVVCFDSREGACRPIAAPCDIEDAIDHSPTGGVPRCRHVRLGRPGVARRVVGLHRADRRVVSPHGVQNAVHDSYRDLGSRGRHGRLGRPHVGRWVVGLQRPHDIAVVAGRYVAGDASHGVEDPIHHPHCKVALGRGHRCLGRPHIRGGVVGLDHIQVPAAVDFTGASDGVERPVHDPHGRAESWASGPWASRY